MKATKARKASLLTLFRRGLVVLGIVALTLASCGGGDTQYVEVPGPERPVPGPEVVIEPPYVTRVVLHNPEAISAWVTSSDNPTNIRGLGFEGMPPNLSGATLELTWWNDRTQSFSTELLTLTPSHPRWGEFFTNPIAPVSTSTDVAFSIFHRSSRGLSAGSNTFKYNQIISMLNLATTWDGERVWYSDQAPEHSRLSAMGTWAWIVTTGGDLITSDNRQGNITTPGDFDLIGMRHSQVIPFEMGYPEIDMSGVYERPPRMQMVVRVNASKTDSIVLDEVMEVTGVMPRSTSPDWRLTDDHFQGREPQEVGIVFASDANYRYIRNTLINLVEDNNVMFDVAYRGRVNPARTDNKTWTWLQFLANSAYGVHSARPSGGTMTDENFFTRNSVFVGPGDFTRNNVDTTTNGLLAVVPGADGLPVWNFTMRYVGGRYDIVVTSSDWDDTGGLASRIHFPVPVPVYTFTNLRNPKVSRIDQAVMRNPVIYQPPVNTAGGATMVDWPVTMTDFQLSEINDYYVLNASYIRGTSTWDRPRSFTGRMFVDPDTSRVPLWPKEPILNGVQVTRALTVRHRGEVAESPDTVYVSVLGQTAGITTPITSLVFGGTWSDARTGVVASSADQIMAVMNPKQAHAPTANGVGANIVNAVWTRVNTPGDVRPDGRLWDLRPAGTVWGTGGNRFLGEANYVLTLTIGANAVSRFEPSLAVPTLTIPASAPADFSLMGLVTPRPTMPWPAAWSHWPADRVLDQTTYQASIMFYTQPATVVDITFQAGSLIRPATDMPITTRTDQPGFGVMVSPANNNVGATAAQYENFLTAIDLSVATAGDAARIVFGAAPGRAVWGVNNAQLATSIPPVEYVWSNWEVNDVDDQIIYTLQVTPTRGWTFLAGSMSDIAAAYEGMTATDLVHFGSSHSNNAIHDATRLENGAINITGFNWFRSPAARPNEWVNFNNDGTNLFPAVPQKYAVSGNFTSPGDLISIVTDNTGTADNGKMLLKMTFTFVGYANATWEANGNLID